MKIHLYYDVFMVPPVAKIKEFSARKVVLRSEDRPVISLYRFAKIVSLPNLLVPGQTYCMGNDPVGSSECAAISVSRSGAFEDADGIAKPFMVISDCFWLSFDAWRLHEADGDQLKLSLGAQIVCWQEEDSNACRDMGSRFTKSGWSPLRSDSDLLRLIPSLSEEEIISEVEKSLKCTM